MSQVPRAEHRKAITMLLVANLCWGLSFPAIKVMEGLHGKLMPGASSWFSALYTVAPRLLLATLLLALFQIRRGWNVTRSELVQGIVIGLFAAGGLLLQNDALHYTAASTSAFLTQFYAITIPVYLAVKSRRSPGTRVWLSCLLVLAGVAVLGRFDWRQMHLGRGEIETLLCSLFFMGQILWLEKKEYSANRPGQLTLVMFATQTAVFVPLTFLLSPGRAAILAPWSSPPWLVFVGVLAVVCTVIAYGLMNRWQPKITATEAGLIYCVEPILASLMALFLPAIFARFAGIDYANETATWTLLIGGGLITAANILIQLKPPAKDLPAA